MRWPKLLLLIGVILLLGWGIYDLLSERRVLQNDLKNLKEELTNLATENQKLMARIEYFKRPENILKELKSQFNYREADEGLIIIVSNATTTR